MNEIAVEDPEDWWAVEALYDLCFGPTRSALSSYRLRQGPPCRPLCLTVGDHGQTAAAIRFWPAQVSAQPVLLLGPVAVHPTRQGEGLGRALIREGLSRAEALGWARVLLVGDAPYYGRFGFHRVTGVRLPPPTNPDRVLGLSLPRGDWGALTGDVRAWTGPPLPEDGRMPI